MNKPKLRRRVPLIPVISLILGLTGLTRGQTPAQPGSPSQGRAEQEALSIIRQEAAAGAAFRRAQAMQAAAAANPGSSTAPAPAATVSATSTTGASAELPALRVAVTSVNESRNSQGRGTINLNLSIVGEGLPPTAVVKQITVTKAEDNLGNVLGASASPSSLAAAQSRMMSTMSMASLAGGRGGVGMRPLSGQASLTASVRKAESLTYAEGTIDLFLPSESNGSMIRIPNVGSHPGRIENPDLAKQGIEFHFLPDQASYDEAKSQVAGFQIGAQPPDFPNGVGYFVRDPSSRLVPQFQEADGTVIRTNGSGWNGDGNGNRTGFIQLPGPLPAGAQLVFFLVIPEAIKTVPFRVEDIALP